jgi:hypothetical protein
MEGSSIHIIHNQIVVNDGDIVIDEPFPCVSEAGKSEFVTHIIPSHFAKFKYGLT